MTSLKWELLKDKMVDCDCRDWEPQIKKIADPIKAWQERGQFEYSKDHFLAWRFCAWCGEKLEEDNVEISGDGALIPSREQS